MPKGRYDSMNVHTSFYRSRHNSIIAGVCGALSDRLAVDVTWIRLGFVLSVLFSLGWALLAYLGIWVLSTVEPG